MKNQSIIYCIVLLFVGISASAQQDTIRTDDIEIVKEYTPFVEDGKKQQFQPVMPQIEATDRGNLSYDLPSAFVETQYEPDELQPLPFDQASQRTIRSGYLKGGYGSASNPLVQLALNAMEDENYTIGVRGGFQAVDGDDLIAQSMSDAKLDVFATKELTNATLDAGIGYHRNENSLYGFDQTNFGLNQDFESDKVFNIISGSIGIESAIPDVDAIRHKTHVNFNLLSENLTDLSESQVGLETVLSKRIMDGLDASLAGDITTRTSKNDNHVDTEFQEQKETVLNLTPSFKPTISGVDLELGASINNDEQHEVKIFPHISAEVPMTNNAFTFFAGWTGRTIMNGYDELQQVNPRLSSQVTTRNYTKEIRTPAGIRGNLSEQFSFSASVSQEVTKEATLWMNTTDPEQADFQTNSVFQPVFEEKLVSWKPQFNANFQFGEAVSIVTDVAYNFYETDTFTEAFGLPDLDAELGLQVRPIDRLELNGGFEAFSGVDYMLTDGQTGTLDAVFNANLGASFDLNDRFAIFIDANNLANSNVERWKNYIGVGTNILGGIVFSFE